MTGWRLATIAVLVLSTLAVLAAALASALAYGWERLITAVIEFAAGAAFAVAAGRLRNDRKP